ncbi:hypothetical protein JOQ06_005841 [Pogonophryne albipinna]|nr:hypothetical protein JOQ06_005841 [Pogonophryne albipinna]
MNPEINLSFLVIFPQSAAAAPSPVMGNMPPNDGMPGGPMPGGPMPGGPMPGGPMPGGPMPPGFFQLTGLLQREQRKSIAAASWPSGEDIAKGELTQRPQDPGAQRCRHSTMPAMPTEHSHREGCMVGRGPPGSQPSPHAQPPPHNPSNPMMGPHGQEAGQAASTVPFMSPRYPGGPRPSLRMPNQPPGSIPGSQPLLPNSLDPTRPQGHPNMGGPMRMNPPRGMGGMGPQNYGGGMRPPPNSMGPGMPGMNMGPGGRGPWPNPNSNSIAYSSSSPGNYVGPPGGGGPPGTPIMPSPGDSTNSSENIYTMMNPIGPGGNRPNFPMGPGPDGPMGGMGAMEQHHMNGSLGSGDMDGLPKNSPNNMAGMNNPPGTPRDDGEMAGNFLNPFQSESYSPNMTMSV